MSNYYSTSLSLILQNAGENSTTWGSFVNTNFQTLLEQAIVGQTSVVMANADYTLTSSQGVSNEARNAVLILTGNQNATYNVIVPAVPKLYIITNNLNSSATAYFKVTGSSTSFSIPNGYTIMVYCTGVNTGTAFYALNYAANATNLVSGGTIASNVTATTQAAGTNNTTVATTAFATTAIQAIYPVGSIYTSTVSTNPNSLFGFGTWVAFGAGRVMIGNGGGYSAGATGGSADATLVSHNHTFSGATASGNASITDPGHYHNYGFAYGANGMYGQAIGGSGPFTSGFTGSGQVTFIGSGTEGAVTGIYDSGHAHGFSGTTSAAGSSATNANLQPYIVVYMWNRTA
jgi:hypothetical protein